MGDAFRRWAQTLYERDCVSERERHEVEGDDAASSMTIDVHILHHPLFRPAPRQDQSTAAADVLLQRAVSSMASRLTSLSAPPHVILESAFRDALEANTGSTTKPTTSVTKECPICRKQVEEPIQCFAAPENGLAVATCCVCGEEKDMRSERVTLSCMHPLCMSCFSSMPLVRGGGARPEPRWL